MSGRPGSDPQALWREYLRTSDPALRDRLVLTFAPLVKHVVWRKLRELPPDVEADDLISCGLIALMGAIDRYDARAGATLEQFAWTRIHGAVLDELRRMDWAPRSVRRWQRDIDRVSTEFTAIHGRTPTTREVAAALSVSTDELRRRRGDVDRIGIASLNVVLPGSGGTPVERMDTLVDDEEQTDPLRATATRDARERFRAAFAELAPRERELAILLYVRELTLAEAGRVLGVSESRVCQLHRALRERLREALAADEALFSVFA